MLHTEWNRNEARDVEIPVAAAIAAIRAAL